MNPEDRPEDYCPEFCTGEPVDASDLLFRDPFIDDLWESLLSRHVLLAAPRRTGKTSVMDALRSSPRHDYTVIYENVQDLDHPADFFISVLARFNEEHPRFLKDLLSTGWGLLTTAFGKIKEMSVSEFKVALRESDPNWKDNWRTHGEELFSRIRKNGSPVLIIIDELPDMILQLRNHDNALDEKERDQKLVQPFLAWFRSQRQKPKPKDDPIRWLIGGSVNLSSTLDSLGHIDLVNDLHEEELPLFTDEEVIEFVHLMLSKRNVPFEHSVPTRILQRLGRPIPIFLQMVTQDLYRDWKRRPDKTQTPLTDDDVDRIFDDLVTKNAARSRLKHYYTRLERYYPEPALTAAHQILSAVSLSPNGLKRTTMKQTFDQSLHEDGSDLKDFKRKQLFDNLLADLENDFYIMENPGDEARYDFASGILKAWWRKYYA